MHLGRQLLAEACDVVLQAAQHAWRQESMQLPGVRRLIALLCFVITLSDCSRISGQHILSQMSLQQMKW